MIPEDIEKWKSSTKRLSIGVSITTVLLLLYNIALFLPANIMQDNDTETSQLVLVLGVVTLILALTYFGIVNYTRGLSRFAANFNNSGKRGLWMIRWSFVLYLAGVVLQVIVFRVVSMTVNSLGQLLLGNIMLLAADILGIAGFLSLATADNMTHDGRKGAVNMIWVIVLLFIGSCLAGWVLQAQDNTRLIWKIMGLIINIIATAAFFKNWKCIITVPEAEQDVPQPLQQNEVNAPASDDDKKASDTPND